MQIKTSPGDFVVDEIAELPLSKQGPFAVYSLSKQGWNTTTLLYFLSKEFSIPYKDFSYGGRKDKYAQTRQYITIRNSRIQKAQEKYYSLTHIGFMSRPMGPDLINGNKFEITIRKIKEPETYPLKENTQNVGLLGYPNYFDDQRFGSFSPTQGFFADKILKKHFNGALKVYLSATHPDDKREVKERKGFFYQHWKDWPACSLKAHSPYEKDAFAGLTKNPASYLAQLVKIPREDLALLFSVYQSYLWNETLRRVIAALGITQTSAYRGLCGDYLFYRQLDKQTLAYLKNLSLPTAGAKTIMPDDLTGKIYDQLLKENGLRPSLFNNIKTRQAHFKSIGRRAIVYPQDLSSNFAEDEVYPQHLKLILKFSLPRGSFGTMLVKRLWSR